MNISSPNEWLNGKHLLRAIIQTVKFDSEVRIHLLSRNGYQFADPERIAGLVIPEHVERHGSRTQYLQIASPVR